MTIDDLLKQGIAALNAGRKEEAHDLLLQVVQQDERNEMGWLWLSGVVETDDDRRTCLGNVLAINPNNSVARRGLESLKARQGIRSLSATTPPAPSSPSAVATRKKPAPSSTASVSRPAQQKKRATGNEVAYYSDNNVTITNTRAIIKGKTDIVLELCAQQQPNHTGEENHRREST